ncbi:hypothetical protein PHYSODRAFT_326379 [Phytophthora sojae]|uniref:Uncharacterized protein n=1 Tax=Phytophthora sojae (strain P6497) TaxID=1094619 RepID=G4YSB9_PHYSP|nr:hypothetical protein PHYSODRAFT_326379 [Phytophthora sojae]EGZ25350.1 hypothetical protein PHYSODRAFT_326379 [Phytophthora sojae]|eukprot:XP_009520638.1 hypothetical protein PHYSODRAFT_326379 [Phytophthora sojae]
MKSFAGHLVTGLILAAALPSVNAEGYVVFDDSKCADPASVTMFPDSGSCPAECTLSGDGVYIEQVCTSDYFTLASSTFAKAPYLVAEYYADSSCTTKQGFQAFSADGKCHVVTDYSVKATLNSDGSGVLQTYDDFQCKESLDDANALTKDALTAHSCTGYIKYYAFNAATTTATGTGTSAAVPLLISSAVAAFLGGLAAVLL